MSNYFIDKSERADKDLRKLYKSGDKLTIERIEKILKELSEHPYTGTGQPKLLKH